VTCGGTGKCTGRRRGSVVCVTPMKAITGTLQLLGLHFENSAEKLKRFEKSLSCSLENR